MSLVKKIFTRERKEQSRPAFAEAFFSDESRTDHPFSLAMHTYKQLQETANSQEEVFLFMIEDVIFSSLYATFYEQLLFTARENPHLALPLIANFEQDQAERERMISEQTENHLNFILAGGSCEGCSSCDNHADVSELLPFVEQGHFDFFKNLYIGMQAIQFAMEELIYDLTPDHMQWLEDYTPEKVLEFRQMIIDYAEKKNAC
ncbi:MAG: hypothetical protein CME60_01020 [Halobacteriovoraceae bacterium]|nr:hypothetical protein [Halobacteriovoraceae bacterium]